MNSINDDHDVKPIMYADAFFEVHGQRQRLSDFKTEMEAGRGAPLMNGINPDALSGWGVAIVRKGLPTLCARGSLPRSVLEKLAKKKTYIFFLETVAQCLGAWLFAEELGDL